MSSLATLSSATESAVAALEMTALRNDELRVASGDGGHSYTPIFFICFAFSLGVLLQQVLNKCLPSLPYTAVLLILGILFGVFYESVGVGNNVVQESFEKWINIDSRLALFLFLPTLLFTDSVGLIWHLFKRCFGQCLLLAGPGAALGAVMVAAVAKLFFGAVWTWPRSLMFGSVLAATDPVAIRGILHSLGVSPKTTMVISGESLMNDGVAIVMYLFFSALAKKEDALLSDTYKTELKNVPELNGTGSLALYTGRFFGRVVLLGAGFGVLMGWLFLRWISSAKTKSHHQDTLVHVSLTLCCAYLTYFLGDALFGVNGVIDTIVAGIVVGSYGWHHCASPEFVEHFWRQLEFLSNTLLFFLSGVLLGTGLWHNPDLLSKLPYLLLLFVATMLIRFLLVGLFMPLLNRMGYGLSFREGLVLGWSGLRGAVGLALALDIRKTFHDTPCSAHNPHVSSHDDSCAALKAFTSECFFYIGGFAVLTLMINGATTGALLRYLGMDEIEEAAIVLQEGARAQIAHSLRQTFDMATHTFYAAEVAEPLQDEIKKRCSVLQAPNFERKQEVQAKLETDPNAEKTIAVLYLRILRTHYLKQAENGILGEDLSTLLLESVDNQIEELKANTPVDKLTDDIDFITGAFEKDSMMTWLFKPLTLLQGGPTAFMCNDARVVVPEEAKVEEIKALLNYIIAHRASLAKLMHLLQSGKDSNQSGTMMETASIINVEKQMIERAKEKMFENGARLVNAVKASQVADLIFEEQRELIEKYRAAGLLDDTQAHELMHEVDHDKEHAATTMLQLPSGAADSMMDLELATLDLASPSFNF